MARHAASAARPQPVLDSITDAAALAARVSLFIKAVGAVLVLLGITTQDDVANWASVAGVVVVAGGELFVYIWSQLQLYRAAARAAAQVTPLADPRDNSGVKLVPVRP